MAMPYVWFLLICSIWGSSFILMKRAAVCLSPAAISAGRVGFGALVVGLLVWRLGAELRFRRRDLLPLAGVILTGFVWPYTAQPWLIAKHQNSAFIGMTVAFTPLLTIAVALIVLKTQPTLRQTLGVFGALGFLSMLMWDGWKQQLPLADLTLAFSVPLAYAIANTWIRRWLGHVPPLELTLWCLLGSLAVLLPLALTSPVPATATMGSQELAWGAVMILGMVGTGVATSIFLRMVQQQGPLFAGMVTNLVPIGAMAWGWLDAEAITSRQLAAVLGVLCMVGLVQYRSAVTPAAAPSVTELEPIAVEA
ncbi:EamA family transporter [bacterium]|nr:EamA family transporter [bacterium]